MSISTYIKLKFLFAFFFSVFLFLCVCCFLHDDKNQGSIYVFIGKNRLFCVACCVFQLKPLCVIICVYMHVTRGLHSLSSVAAAATAASDDDCLCSCLFALLNRRLRSAHLKYF